MFIIVQFIGISIAVFVGINIRYIFSSFDLPSIIFVIILNTLTSAYLLLNYLTYENKLKGFNFKKPIERNKMGLFFDLSKIISWIMLFVSFIFIFQNTFGIDSKHIIYPITLIVLLLIIIIHSILAFKKYKFNINNI